MKKIINGKKYDTKTAQKIAEDYSDEYDCTDARFWLRNLYRKTNGEFFEYVELGQWANGNESNRWKEYITPLSIQQAKFWVERHASYNYENIFGEVQE